MHPLQARKACVIPNGMTFTPARQYFWFYGYPMPLAEGWSRLS
jgi:hypothetical protein